MPSGDPAGPIGTTEMSDTLLPLFPLELAVFPGEKLKLHIFEPRYKQLINECIETDITFGIPPYVDGRVSEYGTEVRLMRVLSVDEQGEMDIVVDGVGAFHLDEFVRHVPDKLYSGGYVTPIKNDEEAVPRTTKRLARLFTRFHQLLETGYERDEFGTRNVSFQLAQEVGLRLEQKVELLSMGRERERQNAIVEHLRSVIPMLEAARESKRRVRGNGHVINPAELDF
jgi:Lon protease-like protein